jgi:hypothetical protein
MCSVEGCEGAPRTNGLCSKHYMRLRRTGDATKTGKAGRPKDEYVACYREAKCDENISPRTFSRLVRAARCLKVMPDSESQKVWEECTRPNGTLNHSELLRWGEAAVRAAKAHGWKGLDKWVKVID